MLSTYWEDIIWEGKDKHRFVFYVGWTTIQNQAYDSAIKTNEILPFATMWMELESIMLSEISQRKTNAIWFHSYAEFKKWNKQKKTLKYRE